MKLNMVVASNEHFACRIFIGCDDLANEFGAWLQSTGWEVRIEGDVDPRAQPRLTEEEEIAAALMESFNRFRTAAVARE
jgi:hypothetical protein